MRNPNYTPWTPELESVVRALWREGKSIDYIADITGRTHRAIILRVRLMRLPGRDTDGQFKVKPMPNALPPKPKFDPWPDDMPGFEDNPRAAAMPFDGGVAKHTGWAGLGYAPPPPQTVMADLGSASSAGRRHGGNIRLDRGAE